MRNTTRGILMGFCTTLTVLGLLALTVTAQTPVTTKIKGTATTSTKVERGTVEMVEGSTVAIRMSTGELRVVNVPSGKTAIVDGREITVNDLKVGTTLTATYTTTTTPVTERTVTSGTGKVWHVQGNSVILTMPDGKNKMYVVKPDYNFIVDGRKATVNELKKGMTVSAEKIVEAPLVEVAANTLVTGTGPKPKPAAPVVAQSPAPAPTPAPVEAPAPAPVEVAAAPQAAPAETAPSLPQTGSPLPLVGMLGLLFTGAGVGLRLLRRS